MFELASKFQNSASNENYKFYIDIIIKNAILKIEQYNREPLSYFPDVSLWLLRNNQKVGVCTIKANDVIWSENHDEKGSICAKMIYTDVKVQY